jgi:hypothetical protein
VDDGTRSPSLQGEILIATGMHAQTASLECVSQQPVGAALEAVCKVNPTVIHREVQHSLQFVAELH